MERRLAVHTRTEFRRPSSTERATSIPIQSQETAASPSTQTQTPETPSSSTQPTGTSWKALIDYMFDNVSWTSVEEEALEKLGWGEHDAVTPAIFAILKERFYGLEPRPDR